MVFGIHTAMSSSPFGASMITYTGQRNSLYNYLNTPLFQMPNLGGGDILGLGGCHHHHHHYHNCGSSDSLGKAMLWGGIAGLGAGLIITFAKPIWNGICAAGKGIASAAKWCWNGITGLFHKKHKAEDTEKATKAKATDNTGKSTAPVIEKAKATTDNTEKNPQVTKPATTTVEDAKADKVTYAGITFNKNDIMLDNEGKPKVIVAGDTFGHNEYKVFLKDGTSVQYYSDEQKEGASISSGTDMNNGKKGFKFQNCNISSVAGSNSSNYYYFQDSNIQDLNLSGDFGNKDSYTLFKSELKKVNKDSDDTENIVGSVISMNEGWWE